MNGPVVAFVGQDHRTQPSQSYKLDMDREDAGEKIQVGSQLEDGSCIGVIRYKKSGSSPLVFGTTRPRLSDSLSLKRIFSVSAGSLVGRNRFVVSFVAQPKEKNRHMSEETSKNKGSEEGKEKDKGWLKEAVGSLSRDDKERAEEQIDSATDRIEEAASSIKEGQAKEASSTLSKGRRRDKFAGTVDKSSVRIKASIRWPEAASAKTVHGAAEDRTELRKDNSRGVHELFKLPKT